jgi:hypothetical protein
MQLIKHHPILACCCLRDNDYDGHGRAARLSTCLFGMYVVYHIMKFDNSPQMQVEDSWVQRAFLHRCHYHGIEFICGKKAYVPSLCSCCARGGGAWRARMSVCNEGVTMGAGSICCIGLLGSAIATRQSKMAEETVTTRVPRLHVSFFGFCWGFSPSPMGMSLKSKNRPRKTKRTASSTLRGRSYVCRSTTQARLTVLIYAKVLKERFLLYASTFVLLTVCQQHVIIATLKQNTWTLGSSSKR